MTTLHVEADEPIELVEACPTTDPWLSNAMLVRVRVPAGNYAVAYDAATGLRLPTWHRNQVSVAGPDGRSQDQIVYLVGGRNVRLGYVDRPFEATRPSEREAELLEGIEDGQLRRYVTSLAPEPRAAYLLAVEQWRHRVAQVDGDAYARGYRAAVDAAHDALAELYQSCAGA